MRLISVMTIGLLLIVCQGCGSPNAADEVDVPEPDGVVHFYEGAHPRTLDPHQAGDVVSSRHVMHVYETLFEYHPFQGTELVPSLASEMPSYNAESLTCTIRLRDDVHFQDAECFNDGNGRKLVAGDVAYSLKRLAALPDGGFWAIDGKVKGLNDFRGAALEHIEQHPDRSWSVTQDWIDHLDTNVSGLEIVDDQTLRITLTEPWPQLLYTLVLPYFAIVPREAVEDNSLDTQPVGTGPYTLAEQTESKLVYKRNPRYRRVTLTGAPEGHPLSAFNGHALPLTDELHYHIVRNNEDALARFIDGEFAISGIGSYFVPEFIDGEARDEGLRGDAVLKEKWRKAGLHLHDSDDPTLHYISFNMHDKVVGTEAGDKGKAIRKALALCLDRRRYIREHAAGRGTPADQLVPPGVIGRQEENTLKDQRHDPAAGRKLLEDAGFTVERAGGTWSTVDPAGGVQVEVTILFRSGDEARRRYGRFLEESALEVGIKLTPEYLTFAGFLSRVRDGRGQAYDAGWVFDIPDAQNILQLLYGPNKSPGINSANFDSKLYNDLYDEMAVMSELDTSERRRKLELIVKMHRILDSECPWITMDFRRTDVLYQDGVHMPPANSFAYNHRKYLVRISK